MLKKTKKIFFLFTPLITAYHLLHNLFFCGVTVIVETENFGD